MKLTFLNSLATSFVLTLFFLVGSIPFADTVEAKTNCSYSESNRVYNDSSVYILIKYERDNGRTRNSWLRPGDHSGSKTCRVEKILPIIGVNESYCMGIHYSGICGLTYHEDWWAPVSSWYKADQGYWSPTGTYRCRDWVGGYVVGCM